ncbi:MAG: type II toxin-antitoxin system Phd/YefM family antitoxin [Chloroflexota bacterium]
MPTTSPATVTASELQRASGKVLKRVAIGKEHLIIERDGYPVAVIIAFPEYEQIMRERALVAHRDLVIALGREAERQGLTEEQLLAELEGDKQVVYQEMYGNQHD